MAHLINRGGKCESRDMSYGVKEGVIEIWGLGYCSILVVSCFMWSSALDSSDVLSSYFIISLTYDIYSQTYIFTIFIRLYFGCRSGLSSDPYKEKIGQPSGKPYITGKANQVHIERLIVANFNMHVRAESDEATGVDGMGDMMCFKYVK